MRRRLITRPLAFAFLTALGWGQGLQNSGLAYVQNISLPGGKAPGAAGNANVDLMGYNPVSRMMYLADRTNNGIDVIDTRTNVAVGLVKMPNKQMIGPIGATGPNGVIVAINLQQLIVTD